MGVLDVRGNFFGRCLEKKFGNLHSKVVTQRVGEEGTSKKGHASRLKKERVQLQALTHIGTQEVCSRE